MLVCVMMSCLFFVAMWSHIGKEHDLLAVVFDVFCHFPKCFLAKIRIKGEVGSVKLV